MALNTTQPANQKPTGNLYMNSNGTTQPSATKTSVASPAPVKNTWDARIAPASMPGYGGNSRLIANPDYIPGSMKPDPNAPPGALDQSLQKLADINPELADQSMDKLGYTNSPNSIQGANSMAPDANGNVSIDLSKIPQGPNKTISPYKQGFQQTQASGAPVPGTMGAAAGTIQSTIPNNAPEESPLTAIVDTDSTFDGIFSQYDDFFSPPKQKQSLLQEYQSMEQSLGINAMNAELLNAKRIIDGTEDDIRSEVQAVSGFATDSQVLALSNARNKSLVKNYNYLLEARDSAMTQLNTMMNLSMKDREIATQEFDRKMNFAFKVQEFKQKAVSNAQEAYYNQIKLGGADGFYNSLIALGDPSAIKVVEKTLGFTPGGLQTAAMQAQKDRANQATMDALDIEGKRLSNANTRSLINERSQAKSAKPATQAQLKVAGYKDRLIESNKIIDGIGGQFTSGTSYVNKLLGTWSPNVLKGENRQLYEQAQRNFINAVLRQESGAAIGKDEFKNAEKQYFPQPGDSKAVQTQKANNRRTVINSFTRESGENVSSNIVTAPDGTEIEIID